MASLKDRATGSKSRGSLGSKAKTRSSGSGGTPEIVDAQSEEREALPNVSSPMSFYQAPPVPAPMAFLRHLATIPGLRERK